MIDALWMIIIISGIVAIVIFSIIAFEIPITKIQIIGLSILFFGVLLSLIVYKALPFLLKSDKSYNRDLEKAEEIAKDYWHRKEGEYLTLVDGVGGERWYGKSRYFGFLFHRSAIGNSAGRPLVIVVGEKPWRISWVSENPTSEEVSNPFFRFQTVYKGAPTKDIRAENEPEFFIKKYSRPPAPIEQHFDLGKEETEKFYKGKSEE